MLTFNLTDFTITKLHNEFTCDLKFVDNKVVIVAENGMGKTTIVNILYYTLSRQWHKLSLYFFESIAFTLNNRPIKIPREYLTEYVKLRKLRARDVRRYGNVRINRILDLIFTDRDPVELLNSPTKIEELAVKHEIPITILYDSLQEFIANKSTLFGSNLDEIDSFLKTNFKAQILYLPTYRRIEQDLKNIFPDLETDIENYRKRRRVREKENLGNYIELVEFGMDDVQQKVDEKLDEVYYNFSNKVKQNLMGTYLREVLNKSYETYKFDRIRQYDTQALNDILGRIDNTILPPKEKENLIVFVESYLKESIINKEDKVIAYFIYKLLELYEQQRREERDIDDFVKLCNEYCLNKEFFYSREERKIKIFLKEKKRQRDISFADLSSGEKQIVSLFSHLYLSKERKFFVIIDEPELSLSVTWQEKLLPDILKAYNQGLVAVTHSPFIFKNELREYTHGLNEFLK